MCMARERISLRGNRDVWIDFTNKVRKERKQIWRVLEPMLKNYLKGRDGKQ